MISGDNLEQLVINPSKELCKESYLSTLDEYQSLYRKSIEDPDQFWMDISNEFEWHGSPSTYLDSNFDIRKGPIYTKFMEGALTNACYNILDRNIDRGLGDIIAYHWEGNDGNCKNSITYYELRREVCKFANGLKNLEIKTGDRIAIYMPVSIDCVVAMLACARIGAVHCVIFAGFSGQALAERIMDSKCVLLISCDGCYRANKLIPLKTMADNALEICRKRGYPKISNIINKHLYNTSLLTDAIIDYYYSFNEQVDICWDDMIENVTDFCDPIWVNAEHPLFILYTSGSTGKPKGIIHTTAGYLLNNFVFVKYVYDIKAGDVFLSTGDLGWLAGHFLSVYGGLVIGASNVLLEGNPIHPTPYRLWEIVDRLKVKAFFTTPTVIRMLMKCGDHFVKAYKRTSLRVLGTGGETIDREAWLWYWNVVGGRRCSVVDPYGQTENGVPMMSSLPGCIPMKPGSTALPLFGTSPGIMDDDGNEISGPGEGHMVYKKAWPAIARSIVGNHEIYESTYFKKFPGYFWTGDLALRDVDGYYWIKGRVDDVISVSGHLLSSIEIETAILEHIAVSEAAVVAAPHSIKGEVPVAFVVLNNNNVITSELESEIKALVRKNIGSFAQPHKIIDLIELPKTRTGKILRRILHKIVQNESDLGDTSTLIDESFLEQTKHIHQMIL